MHGIEDLGFWFVAWNRDDKMIRAGWNSRNSAVEFVLSYFWLWICRFCIHSRKFSLAFG